MKALKAMWMMALVTMTLMGCDVEKLTDCNTQAAGGGRISTALSELKSDACAELENEAVASKGQEELAGEGQPEGPEGTEVLAAQAAPLEEGEEGTAELALEGFVSDEEGSEAEVCAAIGYEGICDEGIVYFCEGDMLYMVDCQEVGLGCGFDPMAAYFDCMHMEDGSEEDFYGDEDFFGDEGEIF